MSVRNSPTGSAALHFHCTTRLELVSVPSSSTKEVIGSMNTSVWIAAVSTSLNSPWFSQNRTVSVSIGSMLTRNFSFASAPTVFAL